MHIAALGFQLFGGYTFASVAERARRDDHCRRRAVHAAECDADLAVRRPVKDLCRVDIAAGALAVDGDYHVAGLDAEAATVGRAAGNDVFHHPTVRRSLRLVSHSQVRRHHVPADRRRLARPFLAGILVGVEAQVRGVEFSEDHVHDADENGVARGVSGRIEESFADGRPGRAMGVRVVVQVAYARPRRPERQFLVVLVVGVLVDVEAHHVGADCGQVVDYPQDAVVFFDPAARDADHVGEFFALEFVRNADDVSALVGCDVGDGARVPAEERESGGSLDGAHAVREVFEFDFDGASAAGAGRHFEGGVAVRVCGVFAYDFPRRVEFVYVGFDFLGFAVEVYVAQELAATVLRALGNESDEFAVGAPGRFAVVLEVAREVVWFARAVGGDNPHVVVGEFVGDLGGNPLAVWAPGVGAAFGGGRALGDYGAVRVGEGEHAARVVPRQARAVRRNRKAQALGTLVHDCRAAEGGVLPPGLHGVFRLCLHDARGVAAVASIVESGAVRREGAFALVRSRVAVDERGLAYHGVHDIQVAARGERDLRTVVAERDVARRVVVPARLVAAALGVASLHVAGFGLEQNLHRFCRWIRRVEAPEVETLAEHHRLAVGG